MFAKKPSPASTVTCRSSWRCLVHVDLVLCFVRCRRECYSGGHQPHIVSFTCLCDACTGWHRESNMVHACTPAAGSSHCDGVWSHCGRRNRSDLQPARLHLGRHLHRQHSRVPAADPLAEGSNRSAMCSTARCCHRLHKMEFSTSHGGWVVRLRSVHADVIKNGSCQPWCCGAGLNQASLLFYNNMISLPMMLGYTLLGTTELQSVRFYPQLYDWRFQVMAAPAGEPLHVKQSSAHSSMAKWQAGC